jgi:hypothetical protein
MLYFEFSGAAEFAARKSHEDFEPIIKVGFKKINAARKQRGQQVITNRVSTYTRLEAQARNGERKELVTRATDILFAEPQQAVAAIRKALEAGEYSRLNLNPKEVTMAYLIVIDGRACTIGRKSLDSSKWVVKPCASVSQLISSLEQKRDLVANAQRLIDSGKLPEWDNNARKHVARIINEFNENK